MPGYNIDLNSEIDTHNDDMLVSLSTPKFQRNWQAVHNGYMSNRVKFEKNGWAAADKVYDFKYTNRRIKLADYLWAEPVSFGGNGYCIMLYSSEDSIKAVKTFYIITVESSGTPGASVQNNIVSGFFNADPTKPFIIEWDSDTSTGKLVQGDFTLTQTQNSDYSFTFTLVDESTSYNFDLFFKLPSSLSSASFNSDAKFLGYDSSSCSWEGYTLDLPTGHVTVPEFAGEDIDYVQATIKNNMLQFAYEKKGIENSCIVSFDILESYRKFQSFKGFDSMSTYSGGSAYLVSSDARDKDYNRWGVKFSSDSLTPAKYVDVSFSLPVYLSFVASSGVSDSTLCDNTDNSIAFFNIGKFTKVAYINIFDAASSGSSLQSLEFANRTNDETTPNYVSKALAHRFNLFKVGNRISPPSTWSPFKYTVSGSECYLGCSRGFERIRSLDTSNFFKYFGDIYTYSDFVFKPNLIFDNNDCFDWEDEDSCVYQYQDISEVQSVKVIGTKPSEQYTSSDTTFVNDYLFQNMSELAEKYCVSRNDESITIYDIDTAPVWSSTDGLYSTDDGHYIGKTYVKVDKEFSSTAFWPFEYVPCFTMMVGGVKTPVYYCGYPAQAGNIPDTFTDYATSLDDFKRKVLGSFSEEYAKGDYLIKNQKYSRTRQVQQYSTCFDFDVTEDKISDYWESTYPSYIAPNTFFDNLNLLDDSTYLNYEDIDVIDAITPTIKYVPAGVYKGDITVQTGEFTKNTLKSVSLLFRTGIVSGLKDDTEYKSIHVYHGNVDCTSLYEKYLGTDVSSGGLGYYYPGRSGPIPVYLFSTFLFDLYTDYRYCIYNTSSKSGVSWEKFKLTLFEAAKVSILFNLQKVPTGVAVGDLYVPVSSTGLEGTWVKSLKCDSGANSYINKVTVNYLNPSDSGFMPMLEDSEYLCDSFFKYFSQNTFIVDIPVKGNILQRINYVEEIALTDSNTDYSTNFKIENSNAYNTKRAYIDKDDSNKRPEGSLSIVRVSSAAIDSLGYFESAANVSFTCVYQDDTQRLCYVPSSYTESEVVPIYLVKGTSSTSLLEALPTLSISWKPIVAYTIQGIDFQPNFSNTYNSFNKVYRVVDNLKEVITSVTEVVAGEQEISINFKGLDAIIVFKYDVYTQEVVASTDNFIYKGTEGNIKLDSFSVKDSTASLIFDLFFNDCTANLLTAKGFTVDSVIGNIISGNVDGYPIRYNFLQDILISPLDAVYTAENNSGQYQLHVEYSAKYDVCCFLLYSSFGTISNASVKFSVSNIEYELFFKDIVSLQSDVIVESTCIEQPASTKVIASLDTNEFQLVKQAWDSTVATENFWWVNKECYFILASSDFELRRKTAELDNWNGDRFSVEYKVPRHKILTPNVKRYFVTNVYYTDKPGLLVTLQADLGYIVVKLYNILPNLELYKEFKIMLNVKQLGSVLNDDTLKDNIAIFNTYANLDVGSLLSKAEWSNTYIGDKLLIGCHADNNFNQWVVEFNLNTGVITKVIQGYGFVGINGCLTGGMIPVDYFSKDVGFIGAVCSLDTLNKADMTTLDSLDSAADITDEADLYTLTNKVVGTASQQWYISKNVTGIVSHLVYDNTADTFTIEQLPISNNYTSVYKSPSFGSVILGDAALGATAVKNLIKVTAAPAAAWTAALIVTGYPMLVYLAPRLSSLAYLQQTLGQYAFVHYNSGAEYERDVSTENTKRKEITEDERINKQKCALIEQDFIFDRQKVTQKLLNTFDGEQLFTEGIINIVLGLVSINSAGADFIANAVNKDKTQTLTDSVSSALSAFSSEAVSALAASNIRTKSVSSVGLTSTVTGFKTLRMFYSTSDTQHIWAGPGFVEHQFDAKCIAQSSTSLQLDGHVDGFFWAISEITKIQMNAAVKLLYTAYETAQSLYDATSATSPIGMAIKAGLALALVTAKVLYKTAEFSAEFLGELLDRLSGPGLTANRLASVTSANLDVENTHSYGDNHEVFLWPCWGHKTRATYHKEVISGGIKNTPWEVGLTSRLHYTSGVGNAVLLTFQKPSMSSNKATTTDVNPKNNKCSMYKNTAYSFADAHSDNKAGDCFRAQFHLGSVPYYSAAVYSNVQEVQLPSDMTVIEGVERLLSDTPFRNENIDSGDVTFAPSLQHDYILDKNWELSQYCTYGTQQWIAVKDTKIIDCKPSNIVVGVDFCGIASPYTAVEVKRGLSKAYMRPWAVTPSVLAFNSTGYNSIYNDILYHAFDGISFRILSMVGSAGLCKAFQSKIYSIQKNDRFKRSNIIPANEVLGNFKGAPEQSIDCVDPLWEQLCVPAKGIGLESGSVSEDKDAIRWAVPIFTEQVSTLPAAVKTMTAVPLAVVDGITSLCCGLVNNQAEYKTPVSIDFTIGKNVYRVTDNYICSVVTSNGADIITELVPLLGLKYLGANNTEAYFYSEAAKYYYVFTGSSLTKMDAVERFRNVQSGYWDFINHFVVLPCLVSYVRMQPDVKDSDTETDNIIIPMLSGGGFSAELPPPSLSIFNDQSWFKCVSLPSGFAEQGPNRVAIYRDFVSDYMLRSIKSNCGKWDRLSKEKFSTIRGVIEKYSNINSSVEGIEGWAYLPFVLVTSALGINDNTQCVFEWAITFCFPSEMDAIYDEKVFSVVNILSETITTGGRKTARPTHVYLTKELFTRGSSFGYYTFRYTSENGSGNREQLYIWADQFIAVSSITCEVKLLTEKGSSPLMLQEHIKEYEEL